MSWNGNDDKDPWGRKEGPPDIDEAVKQFKKKINSIFGPNLNIIFYQNYY